MKINNPFFIFTRKDERYMPDKLTALRIKQQDGTYSAQIPVGALAENVAYNSSYSVRNVLGNVEMSKGSVQEQLNSFDSKIGTQVSEWLEENVQMASGVDIDQTLTVAGQAADAQAAGKLLTVDNESTVPATKFKVTTTTQTYNLLTDEDIDATLTQSGVPADAKAAGDAVADLKSASDSMFNSIVSKMELIDGNNWCRGDWSMKSGFVNVDGTINANPAYVYSEYIPVTEGEIIGICNTQEGSFARRQIRFIAAYDANKNVITSAGATRRNSYTVPTGVYYVILTVAVGSGNYYIYKNYIPSAYAPYDSYYIATRDFLSKAKKSYESVQNALTDGSTLELPTRSAIKDGETIEFKCFITAFNKIRLNFYTNQTTNYIEIDNTNIVVANKTNSILTRSHGITIANDLTLIVEFKEGQAYFHLYSNGYLYEFYSEWEQMQASVSSLQIISTGTIATSATLIATYAACKRRIWIFGDSYITLNSTARWAYYLRAPGYIKNALLSGASGGKSAISNVAFSALLSFGTPDFAVFATGMNDGGDGTSAPNATWATQRDIFLATCAEHGVEPIFCTIPTVPAIDNEQKNSWIRGSGYRYIDFAKAVGASADGTWYSGMLNVDNVHPTEYGARALYTQALIDLPEIMIPDVVNK